MPQQGLPRGDNVWDTALSLLRTPDKLPGFEKIGIYTDSMKHSTLALMSTGFASLNLEDWKLHSWKIIAWVRLDWFRGALKFSLGG